MFTGAGRSEEDTSDWVDLQPEGDDFGEAPESKKQLEKELYNTQSAAYSKGTLGNLLCQWRSFMRFSTKYKIEEWPVSEHILCLYAQYLAYTFHSAKSVQNYINGIHTLHVLARVQPPDLKDIEYRLTMAGLTRRIARPVKQALPLTPEIMLDILTFLDLKKR